MEITPSGYTVVLRNRNFLALWMAQVLSNTALNGSFLLQLILIEQVTQSSAHLGAVVLAFSLPAVLLSAIAGMVVDRVSKKTILVWSNALRVVTGAALAIVAALLATNRLSQIFFLIAIYILVFLTSAVGQFFAPAEAATIPLLVRSENLLPANSLFTLTITVSQIVGMILLAPLGVKTLGVVGSFWVAAAMYLGATIFVAILPRDRSPRSGGIDGVSTLVTAWDEIREGWSFALAHRPIFVALLQLALGSTLTMIMAELAPGFAKRVLGLEPEDATYVFLPAGVGLLSASILIGRLGQRISREMLASLGMIGVAIGLAGLAWAGGGSLVFGRPLFVDHPELMLSTTALVMFFAFLIGMMMATISIPAQTIVQERSHDAVRGRVFAVQFTLANALAIPPILFVGSLADLFSIPMIILAVAIVVAILALLNWLWLSATLRRAPWFRSHDAPSSSDSTLP